MRAYSPWPLHAGGERVAAVHTVDIATDPRDRGTGLSAQLSRQAIELLSQKNSFALGMPNDMSTAQSRRVGWQSVGKFAVWVRLRRPLRVAYRARALKSAGRSLAVPSVEAPVAADCVADAAGVAELLVDSRPGGARLHTDAGVEYLRWRYESQLGDYRAVTEYEGGRLAGLAIFGLRQRGGLWEGSVCELLVRPGDRRTTGRLLRQITGTAPFDYLAAVPPGGSDAARTLARAGFLPAPVGARTLGVTLYRDGVAPDPRVRDSWSLSFGDLERLELC
jgi:hypothetical protein